MQLFTEEDKMLALSPDEILQYLFEQALQDDAAPEAESAAPDEGSAPGLPEILAPAAY